MTEPSPSKQMACRIMSLYDIKEDINPIIDELYATNAIFTDPFLTVHGKEKIRTQFRALRLYLGESHCEINRGAMSQDTLMIDSIFYAGFYPFPNFMTLKFHLFTTIHFHDGKIIEHIDRWDFISLAQSIPIVGCVLDYGRGFIGNISSFFLGTLYYGKDTLTYAVTPQIQNK